MNLFNSTTIHHNISIQQLSPKLPYHTTNKKQKQQQYNTQMHLKQKNKKGKRLTPQDVLPIMAYVSRVDF
jgi:hypothetical protein